MGLSFISISVIYQILTETFVQVKGVTDCVSEAERGGLLCRQDPLGYDRHGRKYWFLSRRIIVLVCIHLFYLAFPFKTEKISCFITSSSFWSY